MNESPVLSLSRGGTFNRPRDWAAFERLTRDLYGRLLGDNNVDLNGRNGQPQAGVDVVGIDRLSGERVGIQCKGRGDGDFARSAGLSEKDLRAEVEKAKTFVPPLQRFVIVTTGQNDVHLQQVARELTETHRANGFFPVDFHGWDWVEGRLAEHVDLAAGYGLIAVSQPSPSSMSESRIAREIGARLGRALELMNSEREGDDRFTLQGLARHVGHKDWRRLEQIAGGMADADEAELTGLANKIGLNLEWLIEGKGAPFCTDADTYRTDVEDIYADILALRPERIVFVRQRGGGYGHHDAFIVVKCDDVRWQVFRNTHPACAQVGSTGAGQLFDLCRLFRKLDYADMENRVPCYATHLDSPVFEQLLEGECHPGTVLRYARNDHWWQAFSALRDDWIKGDAPHETSLREAIHIVRHQLARARDAATRHDHAANILAWGHFRLTPPGEEDGAVEPWT